MMRWHQQRLAFRTHGGCRVGAGRKPAKFRGDVPHRARPEHRKREPAHVTLRVVRGLPSLRKDLLFLTVRRAFGQTARAWFRVVEYSVQTDHVHLLVEADDKVSLSRGMTGLAVRIARALNRNLCRQGRVWCGRYHARSLRTPREVRNGIVYVLMNAKKHLRGALELDPCSSAPWFTGWSAFFSIGPPPVPLPAAETWLLRTGWKRHGLIGMAEKPASVLRTR
jgi:REP-associated tyrosine transposase